ncbi:MAG: hypothetical protein K6U74_20310, partial [Firmicutes bacterium]|nr:hypothetical protein [Bacillota bacterium]
MASVEAPVFLATLLAHLVVEFVWQDGDQLRGGPKAARWVSATLTHAWRVCVLTALPASAYGIRRGLELAVIVTAA